MMRGSLLLSISTVRLVEGIEPLPGVMSVTLAWTMMSSKDLALVSILIQTIESNRSHSTIPALPLLVRNAKALSSLPSVLLGFRFEAPESDTIIQDRPLDVSFQTISNLLFLTTNRNI
jgi:hypothetical protein